jgi:hypothetical protein
MNKPHAVWAKALLLDVSIIARDSDEKTLQKPQNGK